jgi:polysaccharide export outer membrane protein
MSFCLLGLGAWTPAIAQDASVAAPAYRLGPGDKLKVTTYGEDQLTGEFAVGPEGDVSLPLVGSVKAAGLTTSEFARAVEQAEGPRFVSNPRVSVEVTAFRPFYILGEVNHPGQFPFVQGMTVMDAVATASGFTYRANIHKVRIRHSGESADHEERVTASTMVQPGDTIWVNERFF